MERVIWLLSIQFTLTFIILTLSLSTLLLFPFIMKFPIYDFIQNILMQSIMLSPNIKRVYPILFIICNRIQFLLHLLIPHKLEV